MIKKGLNRILLILKESYYLLKGKWSLSYVMWNIIWWGSWSIKWMSLNNKAAIKLAKHIEKHLLKHYGDIIEKYSTANESTTKCQDFKIWVFWGQGKENMPALVKACYNKMVENNPNVQLIDMNNIHKFVEIPQGVYEKLQKKRITFTSFSDILRHTLLAQHGGVWIDSTVWFPNKMPDIVQESTIFSPHNVETDTTLVGYALGSNKVSSVTFCFMRDMLTAVCIKENIWPTYLFVGYLLDFAYKHLPATKAAIDAIPQNNTRRFMLFALMNKPWNEEVYNDLIKDNFIFKLSYKANYKLTCDGEKTFYAQLIENNK